MEWSYWAALGVVGVLGLVAIVAVGLVARTKERELQQQMSSPPQRAIPHFAPEQPAPRYLSELESRTEPVGVISTELSPAERQELRSSLDKADRIKAGYPLREFATDRTSGYAVLADPVIAVLAQGINSIREMLPIVERAAGRPIVVAAAEFASEVIDTLRANKTQRLLQVVVIWCPELDDRDQICSLTGAHPISRANLQSGWLPESDLGQAARWVADADQSWIFTDQASATSNTDQDR